MVLNRVFHQPLVMRPSARPDITLKNVDQLFQSASFRDTVADHLCKSVQIPTITYDGMGHVGRDARWDVFFQFSELLEKSFPRV